MGLITFLCLLNRKENHVLLNDHAIVCFKVCLLIGLLLGLRAAGSIFDRIFSVDVARDLKLCVRNYFLVLYLIQVGLIGEPELETFVKEAIEKTFFLEHHIQGHLGADQGFGPFRLSQVYALPPWRELLVVLLRGLLLICVVWLRNGSRACTSL